EVKNTMAYDFKAARKRREDLVNMYRALKRQKHEEDGTWDWWIMAQIDEIDREIEEAHRSQNGKMTVGQDGHPVKQFENVLTPIVPQWGIS
ncbi:hypothetical protein, partial [Paenibacillus naphthalenovorans]|uniref:hypothetical protein n=1 Tax=Paenibacillus naphthalenovorans TaxID=162209 RepID=UPI003D283457